jgi:hypothetical protein
MVNYTDPLVDASSRYRLKISQKELFFGTILVGNASPDIEITLENIGWEDILFQSLSITGPFSLVRSNCPDVLKPGQIGRVTVAFTPTSFGPWTGALFIMAGYAGDHNIRLVGAGYNSNVNNDDLSGIPIFLTRADLENEANLVYPNGAYALVVSDITLANNDFYKKTGNSGLGTWGDPLGKLSNIIVNSQIDLEDLDNVINGAANLANPGHPAGTVTLRNGETYKTLANILGLQTTQQETATAQAVLAQAAANTATIQAGLATTNGATQVALAAAQVTLAATQAALATTNGAAQVTLAAAQVTAAGASASAAAGSATEALAAAALQPAPGKITYCRALKASDSYQLNFVDITAPGDSPVMNLTVPSHSLDPQPIGRKFEFLRTGGAAVRFTADYLGEAVIIGPDGTDLGLSGNQYYCTMVNEGPNLWRIFGDLTTTPGLVADPSGHDIFVEVADLSSLRQEHTGASATTPVTAIGQSVGSIKNKGTIGGWFVCPAADRRYTLELIDGAYMVRRASATSFLKHDSTGLDLSTLDLFVGGKIMTQVANTGIISFQSAINGGVNRNDGGYLAMGDPLHSVSLRLGSPAAISGVTGFMGKYPKVIRVQKLGNTGPARLWIDNNYDIANQSNTVTALGPMARAMALGAMQKNSADGFGDFGDVAFACLVGGDASMTTEQAAAAQAFCDSRTYGVNPILPSITTLAQLEASRAARVTEVFGGGGLPTSTLGTISTDTTPPVTGLTNLNTSEKMTVPGYAAVPRIYTPNSSRTDRIVISWEGHSAPFGSNGIKTNVIQKCLTANVPVCCLVLPGGPNDYTSGGPSDHVAMANNYAAWFGPAVIAVNTMLARYPGAKVIMTGISGGGWASLLCAALDKRIATSLQVVGWFPEHIHISRDAEQELLQVGCGYMELALLAAGDGRRCLPRWHDADTVGFGFASYSSRLDMLPKLKTKVTALGGTFLESWENVSPHAYSTVDGNALAAEFA